MTAFTLKYRKYWMFLMFIFILFGCTMQQPKEPQRGTAKALYDVGKIVDGELVFTEKSLTELDESDINNGYFLYKDKDGQVIVTTVQAESDRELAESIPADYKPLQIAKYDKGMQYWTQFDSKFLSYHPDLKKLPPDFFMQNYDVNWMCSSLIESYQRLNKCDFSIQCEIEADFYFEKWCMREVALLTNNESWCENIKLNIDFDCYREMALVKSDEKICWNIKASDTKVVECITDVAHQKRNTSICNDITMWYETELKKKGLSLELSTDLSSSAIKNCEKEAIKCDEVPPKYVKGCDDKGTLMDNKSLDVKKALLNGTIMQKLLFGSPDFKDCEILSQKQTEIYLNSEIDSLKPDFLRMLCISKLKNCENLSYQDNFDCESGKSADIKDCYYGIDHRHPRCGIIFGMQEFAKPKANSDMAYVLGWGVINNDINQCLTSNFANDNCLVTAAALWFDCDACDNLTDKTIINNCKETIKVYSNGKVQCQ